MDSSRRVARYDLFKLIVAVLLLTLFFLLNRGGMPQSPTLISTVISSPSTLTAAGANPPGVNSTALPGSSTMTSPASATVPIHTPTPTKLSESTVASLPASTETSVVRFTPTATKLPEPTRISLASPTHTLTMTSIVASPLSPFPSATIANISTLTVTPFPSPTETNLIGPTPTPLPSPTSTSVSTSTSTPTSVTPVASACDAAASRSHLTPGTNAMILRRLNFRSSPGIRDNWLLTNLPGTKVEVMAGPECLPQFRGAYVWWQIKLPNGQVGWSAEAPQYGSFYFMEPAP